MGIQHTHHWKFFVRLPSHFTPFFFNAFHIFCLNYQLSYLKIEKKTKQFLSNFIHGNLPLFFNFLILFFHSCENLKLLVAIHGLNSRVIMSTWTHTNYLDILGCSSYPIAEVKADRCYTLLKTDLIHKGEMIPQIFYIPT